MEEKKIKGHNKIPPSEENQTQEQGITREEFSHDLVEMKLIKAPEYDE